MKSGTAQGGGVDFRPGDTGGAGIRSGRKALTATGVEGQGGAPRVPWEPVPRPLRGGPVMAAI